MGRKREFKGTAAQRAMARFLVDVTESIGLDTTAKVAERFPQSGSRSKWAEYLNGAKLIPKDLLGQVLMEVRRTRPGHWREQLITEAHTLWKNAHEGATSPQDGAGTELVSVYRKLAENTEALRKAKEVELRSERVISLMNQRAGHQELRIAGLEREVEHLQDKEREQVAHGLEQARFRLTRIEDELERARSDRYTVEQAQRALLQEQQEIRQEFERLQQAAADLDVPETEPTRLPQLLMSEKVSDKEVDRAVDEELDRISTDREQRGALIAEVSEALEHRGVQPEAQEEESSVLVGTVVVNPSSKPESTDRPSPSKSLPAVAQGLSKTIPDNPSTSKKPMSFESGSRSKRKVALLAGLLIAALGATVPSAVDWANGHPDEGSADHPSSGNSSPAGTPTKTAKPSPLPTHSDDRIADIGDEVINTPEIMRLPLCIDSPPETFRASLHPTPRDPARLGQEVDLEVTFERVQGKACRYDLSREDNQVEVYRADKDTDPRRWASEGRWDSWACNEEEADIPHRWARLDTSHPLKTTYKWNFRTSPAECGSDITFDKPGRYHYEIRPWAVDGSAGYFNVTQ